MNLTNTMLRERCLGLTVSWLCVPGTLHTPAPGPLSLPRPPLPSFLRLRGEPSLQLPLGIEPWDAQAPSSVRSPVQQAAWTAAGSPPHSQLRWLCYRPHPGLHDFFSPFEHHLFGEVANCFLLCLQGEFQAYLWDISSGVDLS